MSAPDGRAVTEKDFGVTALRNEVLAQMTEAGYPMVKDLSVEFQRGGRTAWVTMTIVVELPAVEVAK